MDVTLTVLDVTLTVLDVTLTVLDVTLTALSKNIILCLITMCYSFCMKRIALLGLVALAACAPAQKASSGNSAEDLFNQVSGLLEENYYGFNLPQLPTVVARAKTDLQKACASAGSSCKTEAAYDVLNTMLDKFGDPHTFIENPAEYAESNRTRSGQGGSFPILGIRSVYRANSNGRLIIEALPGMPAEAAGLTRGDLIVALNGKPLPKNDEASNLALREEVRSGKEFVITLRRAGQTREVRAIGKLPTVPALPSLKKWAGVPSSIAIIRIPDYLPPQTADIVHKLVNQVSKSGVKNIILDLRSNSGGRATDCLSVAGIFVGRTGIIFAKKTSQEAYTYNNGTVTIAGKGRIGVSEPASFSGGVVTLVDQGSASCAEITPVILQNAKRGVVIGEPTYGILNTGTNSFDLTDGGGLTITTVRTLDQSGTAFNTRVTPNIALKEDLDSLESKAQDVMIDRAVKVLQGNDASLETQPILKLPKRLSLLELQKAWN